MDRYILPNIKQYKNIDDLFESTDPFISRVGNIDSRTISSSYKKIIGKLSRDENAILIDWWKSRNDDY